MSTAPTRKRRTRKPAEVEAIAPPVAIESISASVPDRVKVTDLYEMRLAQMEKRALKAEAEASRMARLYALEKLDRKGIVLGLEKKIETAQKQLEAAENKELIARKRMEHTLGRPLSNLAIDPDTGEVVSPSQE